MIEGVTESSAEATDAPLTPYDGCGRCFVGVRRLSRKTDKTNSPAKQRDQILAAVAAVDGHVIAWADDIEVSGATDPMTRPGFGPWLRGEKGAYDGIAGAAVDRIGRNVRDVLNTAYSNDGAGRLLVTADHAGVWDLSDPNQENELLMRAMGAQMEHRSIRKRNQDETIRARRNGQKRGPCAYGYMYVRKTPSGPIDHVALDEEGAAVARDLRRRILADRTGLITPSTEAARLNRARFLSPSDRRRVLYGKEPKHTRWTRKTVIHILTSEASLGYLMHANRPVLGHDGRPVRIAPSLWSREEREALVTKLEPREPRTSAPSPKTDHRLAEIAFCGVCGVRMYVGGPKGRPKYLCEGRVRGVPDSQHCKPAPSMNMQLLYDEVERRFLAVHGGAQIMERRFVPGTGYAARIKELSADRARLRADREAGVYDDPEDAEWFRERFRALGQEIKELKALPERPDEVRLMPTGQTVADRWQAGDDAARRELLAEYGTRVEVYPRTAPQRVRVTTVNPFSEGLTTAA